MGKMIEKKKNDETYERKEIIKERMLHRGLQLYFVLIMKSHLQSYPCPLQINFFWNLGFLLGVAIMLQIVTGIFLALHYTSDLNSAYYQIFFLIREVYYGRCLRQAAVAAMMGHSLALDGSATQRLW